MTKNTKKMFFVLLFVLLLVGLSVSVAADNSTVSKSKLAKKTVTKTDALKTPIKTKTVTKKGAVQQSDKNTNKTLNKKTLSANVEKNVKEDTNVVKRDGVAEITMEDEIEISDDVELSARVIDAETEEGLNGRAVFKINGKTLRDDDNNPVKIKVYDGDVYHNIDMTSFRKSSYNISLVFRNSSYNRVETSKIVNIKKVGASIDDDIYIEADAESIDIGASVIDSDGNPIEGKSKVVLKINQRTIKNYTIDDGYIDEYIDLEAKLSKKEYKLTIIVGNNNRYEKVEEEYLFTPDLDDDSGDDDSDDDDEDDYWDTPVEDEIVQKTTSITTNQVTGYINDQITLTATIKDSDNSKVSNGTVTFKINGKAVNSKAITVKNGVAKYTFKATKDNLNYKTLTAQYNGNEYYKNSNTQKSSKITILKRIAVPKLLTTKVKATSYGTITLKTQVKDNNKLVTTGYVTYKIASKTIKKVAVSKGVATLKYTIPGYDAKKYTITATYTSDIHNTKSVKTTLTVSRTKTKIKAKAVKTNKKTTNVKATIVDSNGKALKGIIKVNIKLNGKIVKKQVTVKKGKLSVKIPTKLKKGKYNLVFSAIKDSKYTASSKKVKLTVTK